MYEMRAVVLRRLALKKGFNTQIGDVHKILKKENDYAGGIISKTESNSLYTYDRDIYIKITKMNIANKFNFKKLIKIFFPFK